MSSCSSTPASSPSDEADEDIISELEQNSINTHEEENNIRQEENDDDTPRGPGTISRSEEDNGNDTLRVPGYISHSEDDSDDDRSRGPEGCISPSVSISSFYTARDADSTCSESWFDEDDIGDDAEHDNDAEDENGDVFPTPPAILEEVNQISNILPPEHVRYDISDASTCRDHSSHTIVASRPTMNNDSNLTTSTCKSWNRKLYSSRNITGNMFKMTMFHTWSSFSSPDSRELKTVFKLTTDNFRPDDVLYYDILQIDENANEVVIVLHPVCTVRSTACHMMDLIITMQELGLSTDIFTFWISVFVHQTKLVLKQSLMSFFIRQLGSILA